MAATDTGRPSEGMRGRFGAGVARGCPGGAGNGGVTCDDGPLSCVVSREHTVRDIAAVKEENMRQSHSFLNK